MAGVKGRSGGPRPNSGGARPGAGRKPNPKPPESELSLELTDGKKRDPLEFLQAVVNDPGAPLKDRIRAAVAAAQYVHTKKHDGGKKEDQADRTKKALSGKFAASAPPKLIVNNQ